MRNRFGGRSLVIGVLWALVVFGGFAPAGAQNVYKVEKGSIEFFSEAPLENILGKTQTFASVIGLDKKEVLFKIEMRTFRFEKSLMQEHFNENYVESHKFPYATFSGTISDNVNLRQNGAYPVTCNGKMEIHGVTRPVEVKGLITVENERIYLDAKFPIKVADYKIKIPKLLTENIAEVVDVTVKASYVPYQKP